MQFWKDRLFWQLYAAYALLTAVTLYGVLACVDWIVVAMSTPEGLVRVERVILLIFGPALAGTLAALTAQRVRSIRSLLADDATTHGGK